MMALTVLPSKFGLHKSEKKPHPKQIKTNKTKQKTFLERKFTAWSSAFNLVIYMSLRGKSIHESHCIYRHLTKSKSDINHCKIYEQELESENHLFPGLYIINVLPEIYKFRTFPMNTLISSFKSINEKGKIYGDRIMRKDLFNWIFNL